MSLPEIRILADRVVDRIAAGEVVERPASVVKELVENALDARAKKIVVALRDGGRSLVRVEDDGHGMRREDALLCVERHATSKIRTEDDLQSLGTLGFRGEALPSIAAVSRFTLLTRAEGSPEGTKVTIDGGKLTDVREAAAAPGTVVEARSLFHAVPARQAFLRSVETELGHCTESVLRLALVRPDVAFTVRHEQRVLLDAEASRSATARAIDLLGEEMADARPVGGSLHGLSLAGLVAPPGAHRAEAGRALYLYVNARWVRDLVMRRAIVAAFRDLVPPGRHPLVVLNLLVPPGAADINVHPTKSEVRFRDPSTIAAFVTDTLRTALHARTAPSSPSARTPAPAPLLLTPPPQPSPSPRPRPSPSPRPPPQPPLAADPSSARSLIATLHSRWLLLADDDSLHVLDGGRLLRRLQCASLDGTSVRLLAPVIVSVPSTAVLDDDLHGLRTTRLSPAELAVRAVPSALADADPAALAHLALGTEDPRAAWAAGLAPAPVTDGAALLADCQRVGLDLRPVVGTVPLRR